MYDNRRYIEVRSRVAAGARPATRAAKKEWIAIPMSAIIERDTFERAQRVSRDNSKVQLRGAEPGAWLLRWVTECGHCSVGCNCHRMPGRNDAFHRYYSCRDHDPPRAR